jgi:hypothetical protein
MGSGQGAPLPIVFFCAKIPIIVSSLSLLHNPKPVYNNGVTFLFFMQGVRHADDSTWSHWTSGQ